MTTVEQGSFQSGGQRYQPDKGFRKRRRPAKRWEDDIHSYLQPYEVHGDSDLTINMIWLTEAHDALKWDAME